MAVTDDITDKLLEGLLVNDEVGILEVLSGTEDGFDCETNVCSMDGDALEDVILT